MQASHLPSAEAVPGEDLHQAPIKEVSFYLSLMRAGATAKSTRAVSIVLVRQGASIVNAVALVTRVKREHGQKSASIRDWHALRTTYVTLALSAGVPVELVRRVTGHSSVDIVLANYFRPDREQFKSVLSWALPEVLTGDKPPRTVASAKTAADLAEVVTLLAGMTVENWTEQRDKALAIMRG